METSTAGDDAASRTAGDDAPPQTAGDDAASQTAGDDAPPQTAGDDAAPSEGSDAGGDSPVPPHESQGYDRKRAVLAAIPFLAIGLADLLLLLFWGLEPLWGFVILLPILFMSVLTYIAFRSGFLQDRT